MHFISTVYIPCARHAGTGRDTSQLLALAACHQMGSMTVGHFLPLEKYFSTPRAIAQHISSAWQPSYVITAQELPIGQSIRHVCWKLALVVGDSLRYCIVNTILCCCWARDLGNWMVRQRDDTTINPHFSTSRSASDIPIFSSYSTSFFLETQTYQTRPACAFWLLYQTAGWHIRTDAAPTHCDVLHADLLSSEKELSLIRPTEPQTGIKGPYPASGANGPLCPTHCISDWALILFRMWWRRGGGGSASEV
jgi:hypothetical protein